MQTQILPNWCKKLGLILFIIASLLNGSLNFINNSINKYGISGINTSEFGEQSNNELLGLLNAFSGGALSHGIDFFAIVAILIYMISKEKVEDDYINKLRLESFQLTFIIGLITTIGIYILDKNLKLTLDYFIFPLLWSYIIIFFIKRRIYL
tara:strand:- start:510 stop:965 length:456 start_codon:yes stop_codon:yes gene_type:complete